MERQLTKTLADYQDNEDHSFLDNAVKVVDRVRERNEDYDSHNDTEEEILSQLSSSSKDKANNSEEKFKSQVKQSDQVMEKTDKFESIPDKAQSKFVMSNDKQTMLNPESSDENQPNQFNMDNLFSKKQTKKFESKSYLKDLNENQNMVYYDKCKILKAPAANKVPIF